MQGKIKPETRIRKKYEEISALFSEIPKNKKKLIEDLVHNAAFMSVALEDLRKQINAEGAIIRTTNGNGFETVSESQAMKSYNQTVNRYQSVIGRLAEMLPEEQGESKLKAFLEMDE